jgi:hypothetical protein
MNRTIFVVESFLQKKNYSVLRQENHKLKTIKKILLIKVYVFINTKMTNTLKIIT